MKAPASVLGISAFYHDSAAALVRDGEIVAAAQEERFSRRKNDPGFPADAVQYCLREAGIAAGDLQEVAYYDHPLLTLDRVIKSLATAAPAGGAQWSKAATSFFGNKLGITRQIHDQLGAPVPVRFLTHHTSHAASAFYPSPFEEAAILTLDGVGEWATTSIGVGNGSEIRTLEEIHYPHSLGLLYSAFTAYCGFKVNSGEYKLMGLAPYGSPRYAGQILGELIEIRDDGSFRLNLDYFGFLEGNTLLNERFERRFGGPARTPEGRITRRDLDLAASVQSVIEHAVLALARHAREVTAMPNLCMAGGVALNCVANGRILREGIFERLFIQPASGDAGGALGAALYLSHHHLGVARRRSEEASDQQKGSLLGPAYSSIQVRGFLAQREAPYQRVRDQAERSAAIARAIDGGEVVGFFSGRMEFGPRALGSRSIVGDARNPGTQTRMNLKIKYRESFRPFAPAVLRERCAEYFELDEDSPYMLLVAPVREERRKPVDEGRGEGEEPDLLEIVRQARSDIPAVTHVDYSARVQTVDERNGSFRALLEAFHARTGCAVLVNTSFNVRGEPIVCTLYDAYRCFMRTEMDMLVLEDCILRKAEQPAWHEPGEAGSDARSVTDGEANPALAAEIDAFFSDWLVPAAAQMRARGVRFFATRPDHETETWYVDPVDMSRYDGSENLEDLREIWEAQGLTELCGLFVPLAELAARVNQQGNPESGDGRLSSTLYEMF